MAEKKTDTLVQRVQESYRKLSVVSTVLNSASDKLGTSIARLDSSLKKLNLGISSWVPFSEGGSEDHFYYWSEEIGYTKIGGKWGLAIRTRSGNQAADDDDVEQWPFNEAPRGLRMKAVANIPDLLDKLIKDAADATQKVSKQAEAVDALTVAINSIADETAVDGESATKGTR